MRITDASNIEKAPRVSRRFRLAKILQSEQVLQGPTPGGCNIMFFFAFLDHSLLSKYFLFFPSTQPMQSIAETGTLAAINTNL